MRLFHLQSTANKRPRADCPHPPAFQTSLGAKVATQRVTTQQVATQQATGQARCGFAFVDRGEREATQPLITAHARSAPATTKDHKMMKIINLGMIHPATGPRWMPLCLPNPWAAVRLLHTHRAEYPRRNRGAPAGRRREMFTSEYEQAAPATACRLRRARLE